MKPKAELVDGRLKLRGPAKPGLPQMELEFLSGLERDEQAAPMQSFEEEDEADLEWLRRATERNRERYR